MGCPRMPLSLQHLCSYLTCLSLVFFCDCVKRTDRTSATSPQQSDSDSASGGTIVAQNDPTTGGTSTQPPQGTPGGPPTSPPAQSTTGADGTLLGGNELKQRIKYSQFAIYKSLSMIYSGIDLLSLCSDPSQTDNAKARAVLTSYTTELQNTILSVDIQPTNDPLYLDPVTKQTPVLARIDSTGKVLMSPAALSSDDTAIPILAHEIGHTIYPDTSPATESLLNSMGACILSHFKKNRPDPGTLDSSFGTFGKTWFQPTWGSRNYVESLALQGDGKIFAAGWSTAPTGNDGSCVLRRINVDGTADTNFASMGVLIPNLNVTSSYCSGSSSQSDGSALVSVGVNYNYFKNAFMNLSVVNKEGTTPQKIYDSGTAFATPYSFQPWGHQTQTDGKVIVFGGIGRTSATGVNFWEPYFERHESTGVLDASFNNAKGGVYLSWQITSEKFGSVTSVAVDSKTGKIVFGGYVSGPPPNQPYLFVGRRNQDGTLDTSFTDSYHTAGFIFPGSQETRYGKLSQVLVRDGGKVIAIGQIMNGTLTQTAIFAFNADGSPDGSFGDGGRRYLSLGDGSDQGLRAAIQSDGKILVSGVTEQGGVRRFFVLRLLPDGTYDPTFNGSGKIVVAVRDGNARSDFSNPGGLGVQPNGKIIVGGSTDMGIGSGNIGFAFFRLNSDSSLGDEFRDFLANHP